jgi:hypothetical protein
VETLAADVPALRLDAMRMEAECFLAEGRHDSAGASFQRTLEAAAALPPDVRRATCFAYAGESLARLEESRMRAGLAEATRARVLELENAIGNEVRA